MHLEAADLPTFDGSHDKISSWVYQVRNACYAHHEDGDASRQNRIILAATILARLRGKAGIWAIKNEAPGFVMKTASETIDNVLATIASKFTNRDWIRQQARELYSVPSAGKTWTIFSVDFETQAGQGNIPLDDPSPLSAAAIALRIAIGNENRERYQMVTGCHPDDMSYEELVSGLRRSWKVPTTRAAPSSSPAKTTPHRQSATEQITNNRSVVGIPLPLPCKNKSFDTEPTIPITLRGKLAESPGLSERLFEQQRCYACRRKAAEHGPSLPAAKEAGMFSAPKSAPARSADTE